MEQQKETEISIKKKKLRNIAMQHGDAYIIEVAQGMNVHDASDQQKREIITLYQEILSVETLKGVEVDVLASTLKPDSLLERFAYRKQAGMAGNTKDFIKLKGTKGQIDHDEKIKVDIENDTVGFKCLHYSVTESNGHVEVTIISKKTN